MMKIRIKTQKKLEELKQKVKDQGQEILLLKTKLSAWRGIPRAYERQYKEKETKKETKSEI